MRDIKEMRMSTGLTQQEFAEKFKIPVSTLRKWEQAESKPPEYVAYFIEQSLPSFNSKYKKVISRSNNIYFIDFENKRVGDPAGNWISFKEEIEGVLEVNIPFYIEKLFNQYYRAVKKFNDDLYYDKKEKIVWR